MAKTVILMVTVRLARLLQMKIGTTRSHIKEQKIHSYLLFIRPHNWISNNQGQIILQA